MNPINSNNNCNNDLVVIGCIGAAAVFSATYLAKAVNKIYPGMPAEFYVHEAYRIAWECTYEKPKAAILDQLARAIRSP